MRQFIWLIVTIFLLTTACKQQAVVTEVSLLAAEVNGRDLFAAPSITDQAAEIVLSFSGAINISDAEDLISISPETATTLNTTNQGTRLRVSFPLSTGETYVFSISAGTIADNAKLDQSYTFTFSAGLTTSFCTGASAECLDSLWLGTAMNQGYVPYYASSSLQESEGDLESIEMLVIGIHGANRNFNDYYNFLSSAIITMGESEHILLLCPQFPEDSEGQKLNWASNVWREGQNSSGGGQWSSFEVVDQLIDQIQNSGVFPKLSKVVVTGHSSGGLFTHLYAAANTSEEQYPSLNFQYIPSNSQYYYYPDGRRLRNSGGRPQLYTPQDCSGYDLWPYGFRLAPPFVQQFDVSAFNQRYLERSVTYLLGNRNEVDGALNTSDCAAVLLGETRYERGANVYDYLEQAFADQHAHNKWEVDNVGHDARAMYQSVSFADLLTTLLAE